MLDEKTMVADTLAGINGELVRYGEMIPQTENMQLKQVLKQFRNQCETSQEEIYQLARSKLCTGRKGDRRRNPARSLRPFPGLGNMRLS